MIIKGDQLVCSFHGTTLLGDRTPQDIKNAIAYSCNKAKNTFSKEQHTFPLADTLVFEREELNTTQTEFGPEQYPEPEFLTVLYGRFEKEVTYLMPDLFSNESILVMNSALCAIEHVPLVGFKVGKTSEAQRFTVATPAEVATNPLFIICCGEIIIDVLEETDLPLPEETLRRLVEKVEEAIALP